MENIVQDWGAYFCKVNDELALIRLNLGLSKAEGTQAANFPHLLWVFLPFHSPRLDGLSSSEESGKLFEIEDELVLQLEKHCGAFYAGCITIQGRREFYFYGSSPESLPAALHAVRSTFSHYDFDSGHQYDPEWNQYVTVLYPSERDRQSIENEKVLIALQRNGARLDLAHVLDHWLYFPTEQAQKAFHEALSKEYSVLGSGRAEGSERPFWSNISRTQVLDKNEIDRSVLELFDLANQFGGDYDGWGTTAQTGA